MQDILTIFQEFGLNKSCRNNKNNDCTNCQFSMNCAIKRSLKANQKIHFVLPAFPAKSANRYKTYANVPDFGEFMALQKLNRFLTRLKETTNLQVQLTICSDGHVFSDVVGVSDRAVNLYHQQLIQMARQINADEINFFALGDVYNEHDFAEMRSSLEQEYAQSIESIRAAVLEQPQERALFNGLHKFLYEDIKYQQPAMSKNQIKKLAKQRTYQTIQRSHAWSNLVAEKFPTAIRLSIHPQFCGSGKLAFQLLDSDSKWATPWHNVAVRTANGFELMHLHKATELGAVYRENQEGYVFFQLPQGVDNESMSARAAYGE